MATTSNLIPVEWTALAKPVATATSVDIAPEGHSVEARVGGNVAPLENESGILVRAEEVLTLTVGANETVYWRRRRPVDTRSLVANVNWS